MIAITMPMRAKIRLAMNIDTRNVTVVAAAENRPRNEAISASLSNPSETAVLNGKATETNNADDSSKVTEVLASDLKAVFYVRSFAGDPTRTKSHELAEQAANKTPGMKLKVTFSDGEVFFGTTNGYSKGRPGFFVTPSDPSSNIDRAFVIASSTTSIESWR